MSIAVAAERGSTGAYAQASIGGPMNKTGAIADWVLPLLLWIALVGILVSLVVAAISTATG